MSDTRTQEQRDADAALEAAVAAVRAAYGYSGLVTHWLADHADYRQEWKP